jgi:hypothetical protein
MDEDQELEARLFPWLDDSNCDEITEEVQEKYYDYDDDDDFDDDYDD